jgi:hypothetical protein
MRRLRRAQQRHAKERKKFKHRAIAAGTAAAIALGAGTNLNKVIAGYIPNNHNLPVSQDADADLLSNMGRICCKITPLLLPFCKSVHKILNNC